MLNLATVAEPAAHALHDQKVAQHVPQVRAWQRVSPGPVPTRSKAPSRSQRHTLATAHGTQRQHARRRRWRAGGARVVGWAGAAHIRPRRRGGRVDLLIPQAPRCHPERLPQALPNRRLADQLEARHRACVLLDLLQARRDDFIRNVVDLLLVVRPRKPPAPRKGDAT